jgi:hypothetical protein
MNKKIKCICVGMYPCSLTRGKSYSLLKVADFNDLLQIIDNNKQAYWYPIAYFKPNMRRKDEKEKRHI